MALPPSDDLLARVHRTAYAYFEENTHPETGLVMDSTQSESAISIAAVGFGLAALPVAVTQGWRTRAHALEVALAAVRFFRDAPQDGARDGVGHRGFFYHFLDPETGTRAWKSEISTIDTTLLVAGMLCCAAFFDADDPDEQELRDGARAVYEQIEWDWAMNGGETVTMGWRPERGFLRYRWEGYTEALLLYALAAGSPTHPVPPSAYIASTRPYRWRTIYGQEHLYAGPLFIHQFSHLWIDFRAIPDAYMRERGIDYFENTRRATLVHREYGSRNPRGFAGYGPHTWGITASDGPGPCVHQLDGRERRFWGYRARGVPFGPDDGTLAPWAAIASLPFAPGAVLECLKSLAKLHGGMGRFGFENSYNPTFPQDGSAIGWVSPHQFALNEGPIVLAVENHRTGLVWDLMKRCVPLRRGLQRNGFAGGWLDSEAAAGG